MLTRVYTVEHTLGVWALRVHRHVQVVCKQDFPDVRNVVDRD